jgi:pyrroline-5-carboxylate reductase
VSADNSIPPILLVGGGKMGAAMLAGWRERGLAPSVIVDPAESALALAAPGITVVGEASEIPAGFAPAALVLAVKPQMAASVLPAYRRLAANCVTLSIMAGRTIAGIQQVLDSELVVRAMPNTPAAVRQGYTVACAAPGVDETSRGLCHQLLGAIGEVAWVEEESALDAVTAVSGGGPAYVFLLAELLEQAALDQGLPPALARDMARRTVSGSGALLAASEADAAELRRNVTSPGGTTEQALKVLMADTAWPETIRQAIAAATARSRELAA